MKKTKLQLEKELELMKLEHKKQLLEEQIETLYWKKRATELEGVVLKENQGQLGFAIEENGEF